MKVEWSRYVFTEDFFSRVNSLSRKSLGDSVSAEEASTYVIDNLSANDWVKCSTYKGNCSPQTFLYRLASGLVIDYIRKREGRLRPPVWLQKEGDLWVSIWKDLCLKRENVEQVMDWYVEDGYRDPLSVRTIISAIKSRLPWCGVSNRPVAFDDNEVGLDAHDSSNTGDDLQTAYTKEHAIAMAEVLLNGDNASFENRSHYDEAMFSDLSAIADKVEVSEEESLMLRMHFCDGLSYSAIARALGVPKYQPVRQIRKILNAYREAINSNGYSEIFGG